MHYYKFHIGDYRSDTAHLSNEEDLCYRRLIDMYIDTEAPIPKKTQWVSRRLRVGCDVLTSVLQDFFIETDFGWEHPRCNADIEDYHEMAKKNKENGAAGGRPKKRTSKGGKPSGFPVGTQSEPNGNRIESQPKPTLVNGYMVNGSLVGTTEEEILFTEYPKKVNKKPAIKSITAALKKVEFDVLLSYVKMYAQSVSGKDKKFIPDPATWFNQERWTNLTEGNVSGVDYLEGYEV